MTFTLLVLAAAAAWSVALGRQALPRPLRVPLRRATAGDLARDAGRGLRELDRLHRSGPVARAPRSPWGRRVRT
ncbi:hypothetical protein WDZ17_10195 [Pseudokineococcus basanitobsidens]|uniref:Uncharacterized protein n=1 Tax=Pseudokineococcus basanitobsidens TaxID=1926649 RepID=A0ABU8RKX8_9ACTN